MLESCAPAKINLFLHVTGRRPDGYHQLDSLAVFAGIGDFLSAQPAERLSLEVSGPFGAALGDEPDNLVLRAARALGHHGAALHLLKHLPVASGIGGGSSDAAAALRVLAELWGVQTNLPELALRLGADVPVCLGRRAARMGGIGEVLAPPPRLPDFGLLLVNPGVAVSTAAVFRVRTGGFSPPADLPAYWPDAAAMAADLSALGNDLEAPAMALQPVIGEALAALRALPGVLLARMSGSGATCFGLLASPGAARDAAAAQARPGWWCWGGGVYEPATGDL